MPIKLNVPDYDDFPVTSPNASWLPPSRWDAEDHQTFSSLRFARTTSLDKAPKLRRDNKRPQPILAAQWLLKDNEERILGWAELQSFPQRHDSYGILFVDIPSMPSEAARLEVAHLMSFAFLLGKFDHLRVIPMADSQGLVGSIKEWGGESKTIAGFAPRPWITSKNPWVFSPVIDMSRFDWNALKDSQPSLRSLQHVKVRLDRYDQTGPKKQKRRSLLARLFRPRIDDSLF